MKKVDTKNEAVANNIVEGLGVEHVVRQERSTYFRSSYTWSTSYSKEKYEEQRTITVPEGESVDAVYAYQLLTGADLAHMVIFNAHNQGKMDTEEFTELMASTRSVLERAAPYIRKAKEEGSQIVGDMYRVYDRLRAELKDHDLWS